MKLNEYFISLRFGTRDSKQPTPLFLKVELFKCPILQFRFTDDVAVEYDITWAVSRHPIALKVVGVTAKK